MTEQRERAATLEFTGPDISGWLDGGCEHFFDAGPRIAPTPSSAPLVYRAAKLFECGDYPDKHLVIGEADLDALIARFRDGARPVPMKIEHIDTPLDPLAEVVALERRGTELFGLFAVDSDINTLLVRRGIARLSVGLQRDPLVLEEVSIVARPRVADAALLSADAVTARVLRYLADGKITPATAPIAARLLSVASPVTFGNGSTLDVTATFERFLEAMPAVRPREAGIPAAAFAAPETKPALSPIVSRIASALGVDAVKLAAEAAGAPAGRGEEKI